MSAPCTTRSGIAIGFILNMHNISLLSQQQRKNRHSELDYVNDEHRNFARQQLSKAQSLTYFVPLLHELFSGKPAKSKIIFTILHALMTDTRVCWSRAEIDEMFHWVRDKHRNYLVQRLSNVGWLEFHRDQNTYMISDKGEALMRILSRFSMGAELVENEGAALAEIEFSVLLECDDISDRLGFLRNRLQKHIIRAEHALQSGSPYIILEIYQQLKSAYRWAEQTRETLDTLVVDDDNAAAWNRIRDIHGQLSRLHALMSQMQLHLQDIQRKQIDIASYGLSQLDFDHYLMHTEIDVLADFMGRYLAKIPHPLFVVNDTMFGEAQYVLNRTQETTGTVRSWDTNINEADLHGDREQSLETARFTADLNAVDSSWQPVDDLIASVSWEEAAYRFSLLTLLSDARVRQASMVDNTFDPLVNLPVEVLFEAGEEVCVESASGERRWMTRGTVRRCSEPTNSKGDTV